MRRGAHLAYIGTGKRHGYSIFGLETCRVAQNDTQALIRQDLMQVFEADLF